MLRWPTRCLPFIFIFVSQISGANFSLKSDKQILIQTHPELHAPTLRLNRVAGQFQKVTEVTVQIPRTSIEFKLENKGSGTWETVMTPKQLKQILGDSNSKRLHAQVLVRSTNTQGLDNLMLKGIELKFQ